MRLEMNGKTLQQLVLVRASQAENAYGRFAEEILRRHLT